MSKNLTDFTIVEALGALDSGAISAVELTQAHVQQAQDARHLNAFITETFEEAIEAAKLSDERRQSGKAGRLEGIPIGLKDVYCTKGVRTTAASKMLENFVPPYESTTGQKLKDAGAVCLGKLSLDEFAMGSTNATSHFGPVISPWKRNNGDNKDLTPGGSSGGSAAAVAARMVMAATATDTGGSIRQPAAFTGTVGVKPTYGRCSRYGIISFASSLDQGGVIARTVEDAALMLGVMAGHDAKDSTSGKHAVPDFAKALTGDVRGLKVGIPQEFRLEGMPEEIEKSWQQGIDLMRDAGAEIVDISLPNSPHALAAYYIIAPAEASSNLARYDGVRYGLRVEGENLTDMYELSRAAGFGDEVKRRIMVGTCVLSAGFYDDYYIQAQKIRRLIVNDFKAAYENCDVILTPSTPSPAFALGENESDPLKMFLNDMFTVPVNLAGLPGMSVPVGLSADGLPLGLQVIGRAWDEETMLRTGQVIERAVNFTAKPQDFVNKAA